MHGISSDLCQVFCWRRMTDRILVHASVPTPSLLTSCTHLPFQKLPSSPHPVPPSTCPPCPLHSHGGPDAEAGHWFQNGLQWHTGSVTIWSFTTVEHLHHKSYLGLVHQFLFRIPVSCDFLSQNCWQCSCCYINLQKTHVCYVWI